LDVERLPAWYDVDDWESLQLLCHELAGLPGAPASRKKPGYRAPYTARFLRRLASRNRNLRPLLAGIWPGVGLT
jgi:hypothetical protein